MNATTTIPTTIQLSRGRLAGLMAVAAGLAAVITWAVLVFAVHTGADTAQTSVSSRDALSSLTAQERRFFEGISSMSPEQIAAGYGVLATLDRAQRRFFEGISSMSPEQIAAGYGVLATMTPEQRQFFEGISSMSPEQIAFGYGK